MNLDELRQQHPDAIVIVRMGDFYEAFDEDAKTLARELGLALTVGRAGRWLASHAIHCNCTWTKPWQTDCESQ